MEITTNIIWQGIINGLTLGWIYVLMALGLTFIFGIMNIFQFAHGEIYMIGAYVVYYLTTSFKLPLFLAIGLSILIMAAIGIVLERVLLRPLKADMDSAIGATIGLTLILQSGAVVLFGLNQRSIPTLAYGPLNFMGIVIPKDRLSAVVVAIVFSLGLYAFLKMTRFGQAMVASAQNPEGAILQGIGPDKMSALAMALGCSLAAVGGALAGSLFTLSPFMGTAPLIKGITIIVMGGMGSLPGAFIGGMILGFSDGLIPVLFGHAWAAVGPLFLVILVLMIKPQGLFGHE